MALPTINCHGCFPRVEGVELTGAYVASTGGSLPTGYYRYSAPVYGYGDGDMVCSTGVLLGTWQIDVTYASGECRPYTGQIAIQTTQGSYTGNNRTGCTGDFPCEIAVKTYFVPNTDFIDASYLAGMQTNFLFTQYDLSQGTISTLNTTMYPDGLEIFQAKRVAYGGAPHFWAELLPRTSPPQITAIEPSVPPSFGPSNFADRVVLPLDGLAPPYLTLGVPVITPQDSVWALHPNFPSYAKTDLTLTECGSFATLMLLVDVQFILLDPSIPPFSGKISATNLATLDCSSCYVPFEMVTLP